MEVIGTEGRIALRTFPIARVVPSAKTVQAEDMETLRQDTVLFPNLTGRTRQLILKQGTSVSKISM